MFDILERQSGEILQNSPGRLCPSRQLSLCIYKDNMIRVVKSFPLAAAGSYPLIYRLHKHWGYYWASFCLNIFICKVGNSNIRMIVFSKLLCMKYLAGLLLHSGTLNKSSLSSVAQIFCCGLQDTLPLLPIPNLTQNSFSSATRSGEKLQSLLVYLWIFFFSSPLCLERLVDDGKVGLYP